MLKSTIGNLTFLVLSCLGCLTASAETPLLTGKADVSEPVEINVVYDYEGDVFVDTFRTAADGSFSYSATLPAETVDAMIYVGSQPFGACLQNGSTIMMDIDGNAVFSGDNAKESAFFNAYVQAFYPMNYKPSPDMPFVYSDYLAKLNSERDKVRTLLPSLDGPKRERYGRMTDTYYNEVLLRLMGMDASYNKTNHGAQIDSIIATVDPNADEARLTGILNQWYNKSDIHRNNKGTDTKGFMVCAFAAIDSALTNEGNKKSLWNTLGSMYMMYQPSDKELEEFFAAVEPQLSKAPKVKERILEVRQSMIPKVQDGDAVPTDPILVSPDGNKCKLSDLLGKTVVYIDIWATWCGPCCREIPYMEKLVDRFRGNDAITFVSISRDDNRQAWLRKLDRDKPEWSQYIFEKSSGDEFMDAMGISGIPRFIIIGKDGRFISTDAARPSNENIDIILNEATAQ